MDKRIFKKTSRLIPGRVRFYFREIKRLLLFFVNKDKLNSYRSNLNKPSINFLIQNEEGSAIMRGKQVSEKLREEGFESKVYLKKLPENIKNSIIIFVKYFPPSEVLKAKRNGCKVIYDVVDHRPFFNFIPEFWVSDGIIFNSNFMRRNFEKYNKRKIKCGVIYHHWDPRIKNQTNKQKPSSFSLAYFGNLPDKNALFHEKLDELTILKKFNDHLNKKDDFNCFYSMRKENSPEFLYKPSTKIATAAAMRGNVISSKDPSAVELVGKSYPYLTDSDLNSVKRTINYAKGTFGKKIWVEGLKKMEEVKKRTSLDRIIEDYEKFLEEFY